MNVRRFCMSEVGARIRELRERRGWTLRDLSKKTGLSYSMLSHIETGKREGTSASIQKIADAFTISMGLLQDPQISLDSVDRISYILREVQGLDDDQVAVIEQLISALKSSR